MVNEPRITYPNLPVAKHKEKIQDAIKNHQVVIVASETGSGKTTQIPKMLLEMGYGRKEGNRQKLIGHTQPRRIAARSVASRIASELGEKIGESVGYQVRFDRQSAKHSRIKIMTDGILLSQIHQDRYLRQYDALIIDEAHERSLNIDMLLGYLKRILKQRKDLKVIITSATIDVERFAKFFATKTPGGLQPAPIIEISGRSYDVEVRYRPLVLENELETAEETDLDFKSIERDLSEATISALEELEHEGPGDVLVFLPGEKEISQIAEQLQAANLKRKKINQLEILPLFGRLSQAQQQKIFSPNQQQRRVVLATNVAETSITVPGIKFVIDSGLARISRYSKRSKVQRLPIEEISKASAKQRAGRAGRTAHGIAIRLYSEENFNSRAEFTEPEILRTSLASIILQMTALGLGNIEEFEFVDAPDAKAVSDGVNLLQELGAIKSDPAAKGGRALTKIGELISHFPLEPRFARMLIEAERRGCLGEVLIIVSALSLQDIRIIPIEAKAQAEQLHARFKDESSDFMSFLKLWDYISEQKSKLSNSAFRKLMREEYLHFVRIREWFELHSQLREMCLDSGLRPSNNKASAASIHQSLLSGLLGQIGLYDGVNKEYQSVRNSRFVIWPGSSLARKRHEFVMVSQLIETSRLFGHIAAAIEPAWIEEVGSDIVKRSYFEPHWSSAKAGAMAYEKVSLFSIPIIPKRRVSYGRINPELAREIFIQHALIEGQWHTRHQFFKDNQKLLAELEELEHKARRRDLVASDSVLFEFFDAKIPRHVISGNHFDNWWQKKSHEDSKFLHLSPEILLSEEAGEATAGFPDQWVQNDMIFKLLYQFKNSGNNVDSNLLDGVSIKIPLALLARVEELGFDWLVPGLREEMIIELIRTLPKELRRHLIPAPDKARQVAQILYDEDVNSGEKFLDALADELVALPEVRDDLELYGESFDASRLSEHLRLHFLVTGEKGEVLAQSDDLNELKHRYQKQIAANTQKISEDFGEKDLATFPSFDITPSRQSRSHGLNILIFPSLKYQVQSNRVDLLALASKQEQALEHPKAVARLVQNDLTEVKVSAFNNLPNPVKMAVTQSKYTNLKNLIADASLSIIQSSLANANAGMIFKRSEYDALLESIKSDYEEKTLAKVYEALEALKVNAKLQREISRVSSLSMLQQVSELKQNAASLMGENFISKSAAHLSDLPRYLQASLIRLQRLEDNLARDTKNAFIIKDLENYFENVKASLDKAALNSPALSEIPWMIQELRVSLFAQELGTKYPVSDKRIRSAINNLRY